MAKWTLWVYAALALAPASEIALLLVNRLVSDHVTPRHLPRLKLPDGLDATMRTFVVVPTMLVSEQSIAGHARMLETHYLSNGVNTGEIYFALLTDWLDAPVEHADDDAACCRRRPTRFTRSMHATATPAAGRRCSTCSIAGASGIRRRARGWDGNASAASCTSSTGCCAAPPIRRS